MRRYINRLWPPWLDVYILGFAIVAALLPGALWLATSIHVIPISYSGSVLGTGR